jgi:hypothetical protein
MTNRNVTFLKGTASCCPRAIDIPPVSVPGTASKEDSNNGLNLPADCQKKPANPLDKISPFFQKNGRFLRKSLIFSHFLAHLILL